MKRLRGPNKKRLQSWSLMCSAVRGKSLGTLGASLLRAPTQFGCRLRRDCCCGLRGKVDGVQPYGAVATPSSEISHELPYEGIQERRPRCAHILLERHVWSSLFHGDQSDQCDIEHVERAVFGNGADSQPHEPTFSVLRHTALEFDVDRSYDRFGRGWTRRGQIVVPVP